MVEDCNAPFMVNIEELSINLEGVLDATSNGTIWKYPDTSFGRMSLMNKPYYTKSFLYHTLEELIKYGLSADGVWWLMCWNNPNFGNKNEINQNHDTLFYDEFVFLKTEKLIKYKSFTIKTLNQIYSTNF